MRSPEPINLIKRFQVIWGALLVSIFAYGGALHHALLNSENEPAELDFFFPVMAMMSIISVLIAIYIPRFLIESQKKFNKIDKSTEQQLKTEEVIKVVGPLYIIRLAMFEAVALYGFALSFLGLRMDYFYAFASISVTAFLLNFPKEEKFRQMF